MSNLNTDICKFLNSHDVIYRNNGLSLKYKLWALGGVKNRVPGMANAWTVLFLWVTSGRAATPVRSSPEGAQWTTEWKAATKSQNC